MPRSRQTVCLCPARGNNDDVYLARYAPDGGIKSGIAPLDFHPVPDVWYKMRAVVRDNRFHIYDDESLPRINVVDHRRPPG